MLLSHNFDVTPDIVPALDRAAFAEVFQVGLQAQPTIHCRPLSHPHWIVELVFPQSTWTAAQVGALCAAALGQRRRHDRPYPAPLPEILVLGGLKTTPPTSTDPEALQPGEWGVDVVETRSGEAFLEAMGWEGAIAQRPTDSIFKVDWRATP